MNRTILIFEREPVLRDLLDAFVRESCPETQVLSTGSVEEAIRLTDESRPIIILSEAIPLIDVLEPKRIRDNDPGLALARHIREHHDHQLQATWLILFMSRLREQIPEEVETLLGNHWNFFSKPFELLALKELLNTLLPILTSSQDK